MPRNKYKKVVNNSDQCLICSVDNLLQLCKDGGMQRWGKKKSSL